MADGMTSMMAGQELAALVGVGGIPLIVALTELAKRSAPGLPRRLYPLVSLGWGVALNLALAVLLGGDALLLGQAALVGLIAGLAASGLYSTGRAAVGARPG